MPVGTTSRSPVHRILSPARSKPRPCRRLSALSIRFNSPARRGPVRFRRDGHRISKRPILGPPAVPTRSMTGGQSHGIVEEEQGGPPPRSIERLVEALEIETTDDPKWAVVMTSQPPVVINETAAIPGEHATCRNGVKISPRVNPVPTCHSAPLRGRADVNERACSRPVIGWGVKHPDDRPRGGRSPRPR